MSQQVPSSQSSSAAYRNFINTCRSPVTRKHYTRSLEYFMKFLRIDDYDRILDMDPKLLQMNICDYIVFLRSNNLAPRSIASYVAAIRKFFDMNDVISLNWKKIHSFEPEPEHRTEDRPYTHKEIATLLSNCSPRDRAILLLMISSGVRVGAIAYPLHLRDLEPIDRYGIYKITLYRKSPSARYYTFCTPEARKHIDQYLDWRRRLHEKLTDDSPVFRKAFDPLRVQKPIPVTVSSISWTLNTLLKQCGLRSFEPLKEGEITPKRTEIMRCHATRKFFETQAFKAGMNNMYIRRLMGQKSGLEDAYLKLSEEELLEGDDHHVGFVGIIDSLTIDETQKLRKEVETLRVEKNSWESLREEVEGLKALLHKS
jgi:integrase